jgi:hypothetical protein
MWPSSAASASSGVGLAPALATLPGETWHIIAPDGV